MAGLTLACARLNHREGAPALYETLSRCPEGNASAGDAESYGPVVGFLGQLATVLGRWSDAEQHFQAAIELDERMGHRPDLARTQLNYADMLLQRGEPEDVQRARALLSQALAAATDIGMANVASEAERLLGA